LVAGQGSSAPASATQIGSIRLSRLGWADVRPWFGNRDPSGPQDPITDPVTGLQDLHAGWTVDAVRMGV
jgi:hypothetical protein